MTNEFDVNKTFKGKDGELWLNGAQVGECESFKAKVVPDYEEQKIKGKTHRIPQGYAVTGEFVAIKVDRSLTTLLGKAMKNNEVPKVELIGVETNGEDSERVKFIGVTFDELALISFEEGASRKDTMAFQAVDYDYIDQ